MIWRATIPNVLFTIRSSKFFIGTRDLKKGFPKSALGIKACFPRNQEKKKKHAHKHR